MTRLPDLGRLWSSEKDDPIRSLWALVEAQPASIEALEKRIIELEADLGTPPKDPTNCNVPPSHGHKVNKRKRGKSKRRVRC